MTDWTCVECGLPDDYRRHGHGDGIGSYDCPRCDCGECRYCADDQGETGWDDEDEDYGAWLDENPGPPMVTLTVQEGLL